ncbi:L-type lectin-domain containing protein [Paenibacillus thiaminolyticus]|nr:L-type lectin-domain containing protein [Paenibacillus thiaminolyticus]
MKKLNRKFPRPKLAVLLMFCMLLPSFAWFGPVKGEAANAKEEDIFVTMPDNGSSVTDVTYGNSVTDVTYATYHRMAMPRNANLPPPSVTLENIFTTPTGSNSSVINGSIVEITPNATYQRGGIWSTSNNMMDLTQDFMASMYLYFGNARNNAADGIAFVMHNDPKGTNALANNGASLGVWASQDHNGPYNGIQNSLAVEFDTYINNNGLGDGRFDTDSAGGNHIAWNYPGKSSTYVDYYIPLFEWARKMIHKDLQYTGTLSDDTWRKFEVKWNAVDKQLTYHLQGTNPVTIPIDVQDVFGTNQVYWGFTGSTGSKYAQNRVVFESVPGLVNGEVNETITREDGSVVGQGDFVYKGEELTYTITAKYFSGKQNWNNIFGLTTINDHVTYVPNSLTFTDRHGTKPVNDSYWSGQTLAVPLQDMSAEYEEQTISFRVKVNRLPLNTPVTEKFTVLGRNNISTSDAVTYEIHAIRAPEVTILDEGPVLLNIGEDYMVTGTWKDLDNPEGRVHFIVNSSLLHTAWLGGGQSSEPVEWSYILLHQLFRLGENTFEIYVTNDDGLISNTASLKIIVGSAPTITLRDAGEEIPMEAGDEYAISGYWSDLDSDTVDLYYAIDGKEPVNFASHVANSANKGEEVAYQYTIPAEQLPVGMHHIEVYAVDDSGRTSNVETVTVHVTGQLVFTNAAENISFEPGKIASQPSLSTRNPDWDIRVKDTRGKGSSWRLSATLAEPFADDRGNELKDAVLFVDENGNETMLEPGIPAYVYTHVTQDDQEVSIDWEENRGILMKINPYAYAGNYKGLIRWGLVDAP